MNFGDCCIMPFQNHTQRYEKVICFHSVNSFKVNKNNILSFDLLQKYTTITTITDNSSTPRHIATMVPGPKPTELPSSPGGARSKTKEDNFIPSYTILPYMLLQ